MTPRLLPLLALALGGLASLHAAEAPRFRSVLIDGDVRLFSLADATGTGRWVKIGEEFDGWKLVSFDLARQSLSLKQGEETREISLAVSQIGESAADAPASLADADALLQKMRFEEMIEASLRAQQEAMAKNMGSMLGKNASAADRERIGAFQSKVMETMIAEMDLPGMRKDLAKVYSEIFTASELKAQADFYSTPGGQAMLDKQPQMQQKITELMMPRMMRAMPKIQAMASDFARENAPAPKAAPAPTP